MGLPTLGSKDEQLEKIVLHPTQLAILLMLISSNRESTLAELEKLLGLPRQTIYTHLEWLIEVGLVIKTIRFSDRPRPRYGGFVWSKAELVLKILRSIRDRIAKIPEKLEEIEPHAISNDNR